MTTLTLTALQAIIAEAKTAATQAANDYFQTELKGQDQFPCGFAWIEFFDIKGNTKLGRLMKQAGIDQNYNRRFQIWNPSESMVQNVDCLEAGAQAAADVFRKHGFHVYANSRLD